MKNKINIGLVILVILLIWSITLFLPSSIENFSTPGYDARILSGYSKSGAVPIAHPSDCVVNGRRGKISIQDGGVCIIDPDYIESTVVIEPTSDKYSEPLIPDSVYYSMFG